MLMITILCEMATTEEVCSAPSNCSDTDVVEEKL